MREDAEISTTIANLRTLISEASAFYVARGTFSPGGTSANWNDVTNVPLNPPTALVVSTTDGSPPTAYLRAGGQDCIGVRLVNKNGTTPAYIAFTRNTTGDVANSVCQQVLNSQPLTVYLRSTVTGVTTTPGTSGAMAIGSSTGIYEAAPPVTTTPGTGTPGAVPGGVPGG